MIGCVFTLLLINTFYCSLGSPVTEIYSPLTKSIQLLASSCENSFLAAQIKNKIDTCNFTATPIEMSEAKFECFMFYDINSQLCAAYRGSKQDLAPAYMSRMNRIHKVQETCELAKSWKFTKMSEFPVYNMSEKPFENQVACVKTCGVDDIFSEDTNFYCKYYQWGTEMLQHLTPSSPLTGNMPSAVSGQEPVLENNPPKSESSSPPTSTNNSNPKLQNTLEDPKAVQTNPGLSNLEQKPNKDIKPDKPSSANIEQPHNKTTVPQTQGFVPPSQGEEPSGRESIENDKGEDKGVVDLTDDDERDLGEYIESQQINGGDNGAIQPDPRIEDVKPKGNDAASIVSNLNIDTIHKVPEFNSNTLPDGFAEDDDHFFSFFLTAIILVIFLYVLYHNKSKFRKVILGLLVEGRQSGRRRNSRGHEYRRLDTLEQAMSTNSAAPPSKIIY